MGGIAWEQELQKALGRGKAEHKPILLDFFNPGWIGCKQMDAVTYPDTNIVNFITEKVVPLRVPSDVQPLSTDFRITWTPTLILLDFYGREHYRTVGFLPPQEFIPAMLLGMAKLDFNVNEQNDAVLHLDTLLKEYPGSAVAAEAVYLRGVSRYKGSHDARALKEAYEKLRADYPQSEWTTRAQPYSLL